MVQETTNTKTRPLSEAVLDHQAIDSMPMGQQKKKKNRENH